MKEQSEFGNVTPQLLKAKGGMTKSDSIQIPSVSLPKGSGAIKCIDEKFSVNAVNGTTSFSIPLPFSPARGASPTLNLNYNSSAGNGIFGLGWTLGMASVKRKTDGELPGYLDAQDSDTYLFSEAEDLVPEFKKENDGSFSMDAEGNYVIAEDLIDDPLGIDESVYHFTNLYNEGLSGILREQGNAWFYKHNLGNGQFERARLVSHMPSFCGLGTHLQLLDLDADGSKQLVNLENEPRGFFELQDNETWIAFQPFENLPNINLGNNNARLLDLNGDGKAEILVEGDREFTWYESLGRKGFGDTTRIFKTYDEEAGPNILFANRDQRIFLADMSGYGLTDIVRIRNGEVCYWPNLGYGHFGRKPHIMISYKNNLGKEVSMEYSPSTRFYLEDKLAGKPWITRVPFPVHCISKTETRDVITGSLFVSSLPNSTIGSLFAAFNIPGENQINRANSRDSNALMFDKEWFSGYATTLGNVIVGTKGLSAYMDRGMGLCSRRTTELNINSVID